MGGYRYLGTYPKPMPHKTSLESCPFEEPSGQYEIVPEKKKKTRFEVITETPASLADFLIDVRCSVGHYKYNEYPPADDYEEMERWLNEECEWK